MNLYDLFKSEKLTNGAKVMCLYLIKRAGLSNWVALSNSQISKGANLSARQVIECKKQLQEFGAIRFEAMKRNGQILTTQYYIKIVR